MKLGVFVERDGVLNRVRVENNHQVGPLTVAEFRPNLSVVPLLHQLKVAGFLIFATTNQPGLSRGSQSRSELDRMHAVLKAALPLDDILVCPHDELDECPCRKPKAGLLVEASFNYRVSLENSFVVSDKWQDAEVAREVGATSVLLNSPWVGRVHPDFILGDLKAIVAKILALNVSRMASVV